MNDLNIRRGIVNDCAGLLALIKELAAYEKAPLEVEVTVEELQEDFKEKVFDFFVAIHENEVIGIALFFIKYSTWKGKCIYLDDIVVKENMRGKRIGKLLFDEIVKEAKRLNVRKIDWQVLDWNEPAIGFYKRFNAHFDGEWINCKLTRKEMDEYVVG